MRSTLVAPERDLCLKIYAIYPQFMYKDALAMNVYLVAQITGVIIYKKLGAIIYKKNYKFKWIIYFYDNYKKLYLL